MKTAIGKATTGPSAGPEPVRESPPRRLLRSRLAARTRPIPFAAMVIVAVGFVAAGQLAEDIADSPPMQMLPPTFLVRRWTVVIAVLYMLVIARILQRTVERSLPSLKRAVRIEAEAFDAYSRRMRLARTRVNLALLAVSALVVALLFPILGSDLPTRDPVTDQLAYLPASPLGSLIVLAAYALIGWALLSLVYVTVRLGRALGQLSREPFAIDIFDTTNLLPFGNIALAVALAPTGVIVILLLGLGQPTTWLSWTVLFLAAVASVLALLLPLRGIHHQMSDAKEAALANLNTRIGQAYGEATGPSLAQPDESRLNTRANTLIPLRATVQQMTTWPFRDTLAFGRAVLIASAPLIYTFLGELIKVIWIKPLGP